MAERILDVQGLKQHFRINRKFTVKAVDGIDFHIDRGETYGLVGESGSGKSTTGRSIIRLYDPTEGKITFCGRDISGKMSKDDERFLHTNMQMIFQDPMACLNPREKVLDIIAEGLDIHHLCKTEEERKQRVYDMLELVGLIIADEAISALDVSIQAQVVNLMKKIQKKYNTAFLFIAHDLSMVKYISDRIGVMHNGHLVETGTTEEIFRHPVHPYTRSLLSAIPEPNPVVEKERTSLSYNQKQAGVDYTKGTRHLVEGDHYVLATDEEFEKWLKEAEKPINA